MTTRAGTRRIFLLISAMILVIDLAFVYVNYRSSRETLDNSIDKIMTDVEDALNLSIRLTNESMLKMTTFIAQDARLNGMFLEGKKAVEREGGGAGGPLADAIRKRLHEAVNVGWAEMQRQFKVRQLHYHLGPGSCSFLRVHKPEKFGDRMDTVRYTIVDTNSEQKSRTGFETGRVYSGLRGVSPVFALDPETGQHVHVGALETGTSFARILSIIREQTRAGATVLLTRDHVEANMWPDAIRKKFDGKWYGNWALEATLDGPVTNHLSTIDLESPPRTVELNGAHQALRAIPLRDYRGGKDPTLPDSGKILLWTDVNHLFADFDRSLKINLVFAILAFIVVEILIFKGLNLVSRHLQGIIDERTGLLRAELDRKDRILAVLTHDLRTPFNAIYGYSEILADPETALDKAESQSMAHDINEACDRFLNLIDRMVSWIKDDSGASADGAPADLNEFVQEILDLYRDAARTTGTTLVNGVRPGAFKVAHSHALATIIRNYVNNAVKFTPNGTVTVDAFKKDDGLNIEVRDTGPGIPEAVREALFSNSVESREGAGGEKGLGLGLFMCHKLADEHGFQLEVESEIGRGTTCRIILPRKTSSAPS